MPDQPDPIVVDAPEAFTASWVEAAMRAGGRDTRVDAVTSVAPVGTGQMASCYRIAEPDHRPDRLYPQRPQAWRILPAVGNPGHPRLYTPLLAPRHHPTRSRGARGLLGEDPTRELDVARIKLHQ